MSEVNEFDETELFQVDENAEEECDDELGSQVAEEAEKEDDKDVCEVSPSIPEIEIPLTSKDILAQFVAGDRSLYSHLMMLLEELITTCPDKVIDYFDQYSFVRRHEKESPNKMLTILEPASRLTKLFFDFIDEKKDNRSQESINEEGSIEIRQKLKPSPEDIVNFIDYFEEMNVGLPKEEAFQISIAIRALTQKPSIKKARFWGKIFGLEKNYIIAECDLQYEELVRRKLTLLATWDVDRVYGEDEDEAPPKVEDKLLPPETDAIPKLFNIQPQDLGEEGYEGDNDWLLDSKRRRYPKLYNYVPPLLPQPVLPKDIKTKSEIPGEGANKKAYFVCNEPGEEWVPLPDVTPEQIYVARQIKSYFYGYLFKELETYPPFPGKEREYLRAQIARISAGTQVSPLGYYQFGIGGEDEGFDEESDMIGIVPNIDYEPIPYQDLLSPEFWVHHAAHILKLGRTTWWDPKMDEVHEDIGEEEEVIKPEEKQESIMPEIGPPLLTPLSEDISLEGMEPWIIEGTSKLLPGSGVIGVRSNLWPGAFAFSKARIFENVYLGRGLKHQVSGFTPYKQPPYQVEYELGPEIMEIDDPTPELEKEWADAHKPPPLKFLGEGGEFGEVGKTPIYTDEEEDEEEDEDE